jgi:MraZ protein
LPSLFRPDIKDRQGPDVFVTSLTGDCVLIYPMAAWLEVERKLTAMPSLNPSRQKFLDRVNYYGQTSELDVQGRIVIPAQLRTSAAIVGEVRVFGRLNHLEVWNENLFAQKLAREPWTEQDGLRMAEHGI